MKPLLQQAGESLFGPRWQSDLAREIGVAGRTMRRWVAGDSPIPAGVYADLAKLVGERMIALRNLRGFLNVAAKKGAEQ